MIPTLQEVGEFISQADSNQIDAIWSLCRNRTKVLRANAEAIASATLKVGDKVRLRGLSPKYLNGAVGMIAGRAGDKFEVTLDAPRGKFRAGLPYRVPGSALEAV